LHLALRMALPMLLDGGAEHDGDQCALHKGPCYTNKRPYIVEERLSFVGDSEYAFVTFSILHQGERMDWALSQSCDLDAAGLMGVDWKAVAVIRHLGDASGGHYTSYTKEDDGL
ncbi:hypothetical protein PMAYCL1PPCAC_09027, partial [Pristionchus mayeri]